jgi:hypothetical protein
MDKFSDFNDPLREYIINEILENYIYTNLLNEKSKLESKINTIDTNINEAEYNKYTKELNEINNNIKKIKENKSKNYNKILVRRFIRNLNKANKIINQNKESFEELISKYVELLTVDDNESDKVIQHLEYVKNKLGNFISIVPDVSTTETLSKSETNNEEDKNNTINDELDNIDKELEFMEFKKYISYSEIKRIEEQLEKIYDNSDNKKIQFKVNNLLRKIEKIKNKKSEDKTKYEKNDATTDSSEESDNDEMKGGYDNYGFYKTTLEMIYGGADEDKEDLQRRFAEAEFESMDRNRKFNDNENTITPTPTPRQEEKEKEKEEKEKEEKEKEEKEKEEKEKEEKEKEEKEKEEKEKEEKEKKEKEKKEKKKKKKKYKTDNEVSDNDDLNDNYVSNEEKHKMLLQVQEIKNKLSINSKYITKYYEHTDTGLLSNSKQLKNNLKDISFFTNIKTIDDFTSFTTNIKEEIARVNKEIEFIDNKIVNITFNDTDGLLKSLDYVEKNFEDLKKIISNNNNFLKTVFDNDENNRLELIHNIESDLSKLDTKFRTNINNYYQNIKDVQSILKNLTKKINYIINESIIEKDKLHKKYDEVMREREDDHESRINMRYNNVYEYSGYSDELSRERDKKIKEHKDKYEIDKKNLVNQYTEKINDLIKNDDYTLSNINSKLNIEKGIFDNYKYNIYDSLFKKLTNIENRLISKKKIINDTNYITDDGNEIIFNEINNENIFSRIWNKYVNNVKRNNKTKQEVEDDFYNSVKVNDLNPEKVLEINNSDKIIFIILIFVIRQIALLITYFLIDSDIIKSFNGLIIGFVLIYIVVLILFILVVNLDNYKMRILFNYINLHINYHGISTHIFTFILFIIIMYTYIKNTDKNLVDDSNTKLSDEQKNDYKYKLSTISLIVYLFTSITDYLV